MLSDSDIVDGLVRRVDLCAGRGEADEEDCEGEQDHDSQGDEVKPSVSGYKIDHAAFLPFGGML
jgi:hypothetical protein